MRTVELMEAQLEHMRVGLARANAKKMLPFFVTVTLVCTDAVVAIHENDREIIVTVHRSDCRLVVTFSDPTIHWHFATKREVGGVRAHGGLEALRDAFMLITNT